MFFSSKKDTSELEAQIRQLVADKQAFQMLNASNEEFHEDEIRKHMMASQIANVAVSDMHKQKRDLKLEIRALTATNASNEEFYEDELRKYVNASSVSDSLQLCQLEVDKMQDTYQDSLVNLERSQMIRADLESAIQQFVVANDTLKHKCSDPEIKAGYETIVADLWNAARANTKQRRKYTKERKTKSRKRKRTQSKSKKKTRAKIYRI